MDVPHFGGGAGEAEESYNSRRLFTEGGHNYVLNC